MDIASSYGTIRPRESVWCGGIHAFFSFQISIFNSTETEKEIRLWFCSSELELRTQKELHCTAYAQPVLSYRLNFWEQRTSPFIVVESNQTSTGTHVGYGRNRPNRVRSSGGG